LFERPSNDGARPPRGFVPINGLFVRSGDSEGARAILRSELRPLLQDAKANALPVVEPLIHSLSTEQRSELENAARARGREFDEQRATRRLALRLMLRGSRG
jgi:hypothetical protein